LKCKKLVKTRVVMYNECERWWHYRCQGIRKEEFDEEYDGDKDYVCVKCTTRLETINEAEEGEGAQGNGREMKGKRKRPKSKI